MIWILFDTNLLVQSRSRSQLHKRGSICDRFGRVIATTIDTESIYLDSTRLPEGYEQIILEHFPISLSKITNARLRRSRFLPLERHSNRISEIKQLHIPGVYIKADQKRICPGIMSSVIGFCDPYGIGQSGIEYYLDEKLQMESVKLTIDFGIQAILHNNLRRVVDDFAADGGCAIVTNVQTGKILGLTSYPSPAIPADTINHAMRSRFIDPVEVGSVLKLVNIAMALESCMYDPDTLVDSRGPLRIGGFEINDFFGVNKIITLRESLWRSSNIANARVALHIGPKYQKHFLKLLGLLDPLQYIPKLKCPVLTPKHWNISNVATIAYGYGLSITLLHLAKSIITLVTGYNIDLSILEDQIPNCTRVLSSNTVNKIRSMMTDVIQMQHKGTIGKCELGAGGKTGTANLCINGQYVEGRNLVTMVTVFPMTMPKYLVILQVADPKRENLRKGTYTTAANVLGGPMSELLRQLQIMQY